MNKTIEGIGNMLRRLAGEDIEIVYRLSSDLGSVIADPGQIEQVIMNLAINARDAMMPKGGKVLSRPAMSKWILAGWRAIPKCSPDVTC